MKQANACIFFKGRAYTVRQIHEATGTAEKTIRARHECGWTGDEIVAGSRVTGITLTVEGQTRTISDWARLTGQSDSTLRKRHARGWADDEVVLGKRRMEL